jgi:hypothetical protein
MAYGMPFCELSKKQYARLDAQTYKPLLKALALPQSVHRASLAYYTGLPVLQQRREELIIQLMGSILKLVNDINIRTHASQHPAFELVMSQCNQRSITHRLIQSRKQQKLLPFSVIDHFQAIAIQWHMLSYLPPTADVTSWHHKAFKSALLKESASRLVERPMLEAAGYAYIYKLQLNERYHTVSAPIRGEQTAKLLGMTSNDIFVSDIKSAASHHIHIRAGRPHVSTVMDTIHLDRKRQAQLRARLTLNRSSLNAVRHARNKKATPTDKDCTFCSPGTKETIIHTLLKCPKYQERRSILLSKLRGFISIVKHKAKSHPTMGRVLRHNDTIRLHTMLCTPYILSCFYKRKCQRDIFALLHLTGEFFEYIHSLRPI